MTGGRPESRPSRAATPAAAPPPEPAAAAPAKPPRLAIGLLVVGLALLGFGMLARAPMSPSAVMSGVIDSVLVLPSGEPGLPGRRTPTRAVAVYLPKAPSARVFRLPPAYSGLADSIRAADTLQALLGWRSESDTATALRIMRNGAVLLDSSVVLQAQRQERSRFVMFGVVLGFFGVIGLIRRSPARTA